MKNIKNQIENLAVNLPSNWEVSNICDHLIRIDMPGHDLCIYNEGEGWGYELTSEWAGVVMEDFNLDSLEEILDNFGIEL